jgi:hypothetical protein
MGFEPTTFCMASRTGRDADCADTPANETVSPSRVAAANPRFSPRNHVGLGTESGLSDGPKRSTRSRGSGRHRPVRRALWRRVRRWGHLHREGSGAGAVVRSGEASPRRRPSVPTRRMRGLRRLPSALEFRALRRVPPDARWHGHAGARRAGARRRTTKTGRWLTPIRLGIGASNCAMRSAPSSNSCAQPSRSCARNSIRRTRRSEAADSAIRTQARHSGSSPKPGPGVAVAFGRRCENVSCCRSQRTRRGGARSAARRVGTWSRAGRSSCPRLERQLDAVRLGAERSHPPC